MNRIVMGAQWGDEGKGKIVDVLAAEADLVVRFQGGANAGHTIVAGGQRHVLHLLPSGILTPGKLNVIASGCVVDLEALAQEILATRDTGIEISPATLALSDRAHVVTPAHRHADRLQGAWIGTTGRGIGPCYTDKVRRWGIRASAILDGTFGDRYRAQSAAWQREVPAARDDPFPDPDLDLRRMEDALALVRPFVTDTRTLIHEAATAGRGILLEGAQGTLLDVDHGTYPFVTSSSTTIGGAFTGTGVFLDFQDRIGVLKAYSTRVGEGPFPTEETDPRGELLRARGREFGATTGRPRRCGWLDLPLVREACVTNGFTSLALTKLDVLSGLDRVPVATGRDREGRPLWEDLPGWGELPASPQFLADLPPACRDYVAFIEDALRVPVTLISCGPDRAQTITRSPR